METFQEFLGELKRLKDLGYRAVITLHGRIRLASPTAKGYHHSRSQPCTSR